MAHEEKALHLAHLHTRVQIYTASQRFSMEFLGRAFCSTQVDGDKDEKYFNKITWGQGDRQHHKASHARREEKEWRARERSHGFIMLGMESATAGCGIPNDSLARIIHAMKVQSIGSLFVIVAAHETLWHTKRKLSTWLFFIHASKFIRIREFLKGISRSCVLFNTSQRRQR